MFRGIDERKFFPAMVVCLSIAAAATVLLVWGCAVRNLPNGTTQPATRFEQVMAYNAALAQANDGFADNVIGLANAGIIAKGTARPILIAQAKIAAADKLITADLVAAATCGLAGSTASTTPAQVSDASAVCAKSKSAEIQAAITAITDAIGELNNGLLLPVSEADRFKLAQALAGIQNLSQQILVALREYSVISRTGAWSYGLA